MLEHLQSGSTNNKDDLTAEGTSLRHCQLHCIEDDVTFGQDTKEINAKNIPL